MIAKVVGLTYLGDLCEFLRKLYLIHSPDTYPKDADDDPAVGLRSDSCEDVEGAERLRFERLAGSITKTLRFPLQKWRSSMTTFETASREESSRSGVIGRAKFYGRSNLAKPG